MRARFPIWCARLRMPLLWGAAVFLVGAFLGGPAWMAPAGLALLVAGLALYFRVGTVCRPPVEVACRSPGAGRPSIARPVLAPADGVVVRAHGRERDHRSRSSWPSLLYLMAEGSLCGLGGMTPFPVRSALRHFREDFVAAEAASVRG